MLNNIVLEIFILWSIVFSVQGCGEGLADDWDALIGSYEANAKSIPWQAGLVEIGSSTPFCGGTIICDRFVMTAAHCIRPDCVNNPGSCYQILTEEHDITTGFDQATRHYIKAINVHPNFLSPGITCVYDYDLALIELTEAIKLTADSRAKAACLPDPSDDYFSNGTTFVVGGWDWQSAGGSTLSKYHHGTVPAISHKGCEQLYGEKQPRLHCVGHINNGDVSCKADSGGPLTWLDPRTSKGKVIGVVLWGIGCKRQNEEGMPGFYIDVVSALDWVRQTTGSCPDQS